MLSCEAEKDFLLQFSHPCSGVSHSLDPRVLPHQLPTKPTEFCAAKDAECA